MSAPRILVAGIGNIFEGDDAFGVEVVQRMLRTRPVQDGVRIADFGIRGYDLVFALMEDYDAVILVDATQRGGKPGSLYTLEIEADSAIDETAPVEMESHGLNPTRALGMVRAMGGKPNRILLVGCEPASLGGEDGVMGLSPPVEAAIDSAMALVDSLIAGIAEQRLTNVMA
jgi:hydrogenase maturation protease